ncbi:MAG TPA: GNAT family N-acetyltransferase [Bacteroidia bacterium]|nr:GNAT family N-acetyltransferase [Bacteroidia bacterium]
MSIEIRLLKKGEEEEVNRLYNLLNKHQRSESVFEWEFNACPYGEALYVIAYDTTQNKIVGTQAAIPIELISSSGEKMMTAKSEDTLLDPAYRGKGLFDQMYQLLFKVCKEKKIKYIWGFTYAKKPFLKVGFEIPFDAMSGVFAINIFQSYKYLSGLNPQNKFLDKFKIFGLSVMSYLNTIKQGFAGTQLSEKLSCRLNFEFDRNEFLQQALHNQEKKMWTISLADEYIDWRYKKNPYPNNYSFISGLKDQNVISEAIINSRNDGYAYIEQIFFSSESDPGAKKAIINEAIKNIRLKKSFLIRFWGFRNNKLNSEQIDFLKKCGFIFVKKGTSFVWKRLTDDKSELILPEQLLMSRSFAQGDI